MHFPVEGTRKTLLFFTVLASWAIGCGETAGDKTLNLRIGFDLLKGKNGAPSLRIRDFQDSTENERYPRAVEKENSKEGAKEKPSIRADSFSDSKEEKKEESSKEVRQKSSASSEEGEGYDSDVKNRHKSTKGLHADEYEPEENVRVHGKHHEEDEEVSEVEGMRHRRKRYVLYENEKRKGKKVRSGRKQAVNRA